MGLRKRIISMVDHILVAQGIKLLQSGHVLYLEEDKTIIYDQDTKEELLNFDTENATALRTLLRLDPQSCIRVNKGENNGFRATS